MIHEGLTEVERRLQEQNQFVTAALTATQKAGREPLEVGLNVFQRLVHDLRDTITRELGAPAFEMTGADSQAAANELWHLFRFLVCGMRSYKISPGLAELLVNTNVNSLPTSLLKLPFSSLYLDFPPQVDTRMYSLDGCEYPIRGVLVTNVLGEGGEPSHLSLAFLAGNSSDAGSASSVTFALHLSLEEETLKGTVDRVINRISEMFEENLIKLEQQSKRFKNPKQYVARYRKDVYRLVYLVANALLYITCDNPEITTLKSPRAELKKRLAELGPKKRSRLERKLKTTSALEQRLLGSSIIIERGEKEDVEYQVGTGRKVLARHMVSGHWKHQPCGPELLLRTLIWIAPYYRGPEGAEEIVRKHILR